MPIVVALASIAGLFGVAIAMPFLVSRPGLATKVAYVASAALCLPLLGVGLFGLLGGNASHGELTLPFGLPWIGIHFALDALSSFFLILVDLGAVVASVYALGYGKHEHHPGRVLPFYPAFLAAMNLVVLAADAFGFLVSWEFMSLSSWALVLSSHHDGDNRRAGYIYMLMASFGTMMLLLAFGLLAGTEGHYAFSMMRLSAHLPWVAGLVLVLMAVSIITVGTTIRLSVFARRREIEIMKYVGATNALVTLPFVIEGLTMGLLSGILTAAATIGGYAYIVQLSPTLGGLWQMLMGTALVPLENVWPTILTYSLAGGALVGGLGSMFSIRKHLNV